MVVMLASYSLSLDYLSTQVKQMGKKLSEMNKKLATAPEDLQQQTKDFMSVSGKYIVRKVLVNGILYALTNNASTHMPEYIH